MKHKTRTKALSWLLSLALVLGLMLGMSMTAYAATWSGEGSQSSPYLISSLADLINLRDSVNAGTEYSGNYFKLTADIDCGTDNWAPIGMEGYDNQYNDVNYYFKGTFDGNGKTITYQVANANDDRKGLFYQIPAGATVKNLSVAGSISGSGSYYGGIAGENNGTIQNCSSSVSITGSRSFYGGIAGINKKGTIDHCVASGALTKNGSGYAYTAGIAGYNDGATVRDCVSLCDISAVNANQSNYAGRVIGRNYNGTTADCYYLSTANITGDAVNADNATGKTADELIVIGETAYNAGYTVYAQALGYTPHIHNFTYSADGATISATCTADGCGLTDKKATLTIAAPLHTNVGDGKSDNATITGDTAVLGTPDIVYKQGSTTLDAAPTGAGTYTASITVGGKTATVDYTIDKAASSITTAPAAADGLTYNGTAQSLVSAGTPNGGTMQYALGANSTTAPASGWGADIPTGTNAGTYYVWYKVVGDADHADSAAAYVTVTIGKAAGGEATISMENMSRNDAAMTITGVAGQEYIIVPKGTAINEESWTRPTLPNADGGVRFTHLTPATEYTIYTRVAETANAVAGAAVSADVYTTLSGTELEFDSELVGATVTVNPDPAGTYSYQWYQDAVTSGGEDQPDQHTLTVIAGATAVSYTPTDADVGKYLAVKIKKGDSEVGETVTPFSVASTATVTFDSKGGSAVQAQTSLAYGDKVTKPDDPTRTGYHFAGWYTDTDYSTKWSFDVDTVKWADTTLYAKWTAAPVYEITGVVKNSNDAAVSGAAVTLAQGYKTLGQTTTDENGAFTFTGVESGTYNVIAKKDTQTKTELVELTENKSLTVTMPETGKNSVLDNDNAGDFAATVGGLDEIAAAQTLGTGETITITLSVTGENFINELTSEEQTAFTNGKTAIDTLPETNGKTVEYLNLKLEKTVATTGTTTKTDIGDTNNKLLTIIIPYATSGKQNVAVYRYHGTEATAMTQNPAPGAEGFVVGTDSITLYAKGFSTYAIGYTTPTYSGGGSSGGSSGSTITVPVSGDSASVSVSASVSGATATVKAPTTAQLDKVIGESVKTGEVTIDVSGLNRNIATVSIPTETVKAIEKAVNDPDNDADALTVKLTDGSVTFDAKALAAVVDQAKGSTIQLNLDNIGESKLKSAQKTAIKDMDVQAVYDAYMTSNGQRISDFKGGKAAVTVSYTLKDGQTGRGVVVWYVADDGKTTEVPTAYNDKTVSFTVEHFSNYVIAYDEARAVVCPQDNTCPISAFSDASATAWYHDGVHYVLESGIMNGVGNGKFGPGNATSRAMIAQILWNMEGKPIVNYAMRYTDVDADAWYAEAVRWATAQGIMSGYGYNKFGPNDDMTREQLVTIMYRYAQYKGVDVSVGEDTNILSYDDALTVSEFAIPAMQWAVGSGAVSGRTNTTLNPKDTATRAEIATIIMRYCEEIAK